MIKKRPCRICGKWFQPHSRAGNRQKVCSDPRCQRERHRRSCARWHSRNPDYDREQRLRDLVTITPAKEPGRKKLFAPMDEIRWDAVRDAVGLETAVIIEETGKVLHRWARDAVFAEP